MIFKGLEGGTLFLSQSLMIMKVNQFNNENFKVKNAPNFVKLLALAGGGLGFSIGIRLILIN